MTAKPRITIEQERALTEYFNKEQYENTRQSLGVAIRELRERRRWSLSDVAKSSRTTKGHLSAIENGRANPTLSCLCRILAVLDGDLRIFTRLIR